MLRLHKQYEDDDIDPEDHTTFRIPSNMIDRLLTSILVKRSSHTPVVALLGSDQVGKTTLE